MTSETFSHDNVKVLALNDWLITWFIKKIPVNLSIYHNISCRCCIANLVFGNQQYVNKMVIFSSLGEPFNFFCLMKSIKLRQHWWLLIFNMCWDACLIVCTLYGIISVLTTHSHYYCKEVLEVLVFNFPDQV